MLLLPNSSKRQEVKGEVNSATFFKGFYATDD